MRGEAPEGIERFALRSTSGQLVYGSAEGLGWPDGSSVLREGSRVEVPRGELWVAFEQVEPTAHRLYVWERTESTSTLERLEREGWRFEPGPSVLDPALTPWTVALQDPPSVPLHVRTPG